MLCYGSVSYAIRLQHEDAGAFPSSPTDRVPPDDNRTVMTLLESGFLSLERSLNYNIYGKTMRAGPDAGPATRLQRFPFPGVRPRTPHWRLHSAC